MTVDHHKKQFHNLLSAVLGAKCLQTIGIIEFHNNFFTTSYLYSNTFALLLNLFGRKVSKSVFGLVYVPFIELSIFIQSSGMLVPSVQSIMNIWMSGR